MGSARGGIQNELEIEMKALNITEKNKSAIEATLKDCNGKATAHSYTEFGEIEYCALQAEEKVVALVGAKDRAVGAVFYSQSGGSVANAYKYSREGTEVRLERRSTGWFLTEVTRKAIYKDGGKDLLFLTPDQDEAAIAKIRKSYTILKPMPQNEEFVPV